MATVTESLMLTSNVTGFEIQPSGDIEVHFTLTDASGVARSSKMFIAKVDGSGVYDQTGALQIATTTPADFLSAFSGLLTAANNALTAAAAAGKIVP